MAHTSKSTTHSSTQPISDAPAVSLPVIVIVMGVSGSGKSTLGRALARSLDCDFCEGDDLHPKRNVEKMRHGVPLTDADRRPWLSAIHYWIDLQRERGKSGVVTCSALKRNYRRRLRAGRDDVRILFLHGSRRVIEKRLRHRRRHFMPISLLDSQLATLEPPIANEHAAMVDIGYGALADNLATALRRLGLSPVRHVKETR